MLEHLSSEHLCLFICVYYTLYLHVSIMIQVSNMFYYDIYYNDVNHSPPLSCRPYSNMFLIYSYS